MYYVTMTNKFISGWGWGQAEGKINKFVICCETREQAETVAKNARKQRETMKYINITTKKPCYSNNKYITTFRQFNELGKIWTE